VSPPYHGSVRPRRSPPWAGLALATALAFSAGACSMSMELGSFLSDKFGTEEKPAKTAQADKGDTRDVTGSLALQSKKTERASGGIHPIDWKLTSSALKEALGQKDDGASIPWQNPDTGSRGTVTPVAAAYIKEGFACRNFIASHVGDGRESWYEGTACRVHRGEWEIRSTRPLEKS
jgi:surface antigen